MLSKKSIWIHILIWFCFLLINYFQMLNDFNEVPPGIYVRTIIHIGIFYLNFLVLAPYFLLKNKIGIYILLVLAVLVINSLISDFLMFHFDPKPKFMEEGFQKSELFKHRKPSFFRYIMPASIPLLLVFIGSMIRVYAEWRRNEEKQKEIASQKVSSELQFLKAQLNPHFLFNSLNTIYSLSVKKSTETPEAVINLSELMRYMLYEADKNFVPLEKEMDYIQNYIALQRLRLADDKNVTLNIYGDYRNKKIQPLLFISFIENAFKYGTDYTGKTDVKIVFKITENDIQFLCTNTLGAQHKKDTSSSGIGLDNIKNRLHLLYPEAHELMILEENNQYKVNLTIKFNFHEMCNSR